MSGNGIQATLEAIGAVDPDHLEVLAPRTRDREVKVLRDGVSGVIFIDGHYVGEDEYVTGDYRGDDPVTLVDIVDRDRRVADFAAHYVGKRVVDFGCGRGLFLLGTRDSAKEVHGVELQESYRQFLADNGIACHAGMTEAPSQLDTVFMFHVLEHLPEPLEVLADVRERLVRGGSIVIEVPHARDLMLDFMHIPAFQDFTLWSQHLVLHTRDSLRRLLEAAGFSRVSIRGVQRYGLANHLHWLSRQQPSGHSSPLTVLESNELRDAYAASLAANDMTDTLVAIAYA